MDKIYSRKRIRIPKIRIAKFPKGKRSFKNKFAQDTVLVLMIAIITLFLVIKAITPILDKSCEYAAKARATEVSNSKTTEVMRNYTYDDLIKIYKDSNGNITMLQSNIATINEITSSVAEKIQQGLIDEDESTVEMKLGSFLGTRILSGIGPNIKIKLKNTGTVETKVRSEFESTGINQTIHRIYLDVKCTVSVLTPYSVEEETITNEVVIAENVVVGLVPSTYYNLEGMERSNLVDIVE